MIYYEQLFASLCGYSDKQVLSFQGSNSATMLKLCNNYFTVEHVKINHNSELRIFFRPFLNFSILYFGLAGVYPLSVLVSTTWVKQSNRYILFGIEATTKIAISFFVVICRYCHFKQHCKAKRLFDLSQARSPQLQFQYQAYT